MIVLLNVKNTVKQKHVAHSNSQNVSIYVLQNTKKLGFFIQAFFCIGNNLTEKSISAEELAFAFMAIADKSMAVVVNKIQKKHKPVFPRFCQETSRDSSDYNLI